MIMCHIYSTKASLHSIDKTIPSHLHRSIEIHIDPLHQHPSYQQFRKSNTVSECTLIFCIKISLRLSDTQFSLCLQQSLILNKDGFSQLGRDPLDPSNI